MKAKVTEDTKKAFFISEMDTLEKAKTWMKENDITKEEIEMAARFVADTNTVTVLQSSAEYAKNSRIYDFFGEGTEHIDIWVTFTAFDNYRNFYMVGAYLTDIWNIGAVEAEEIKSKMYIRKFAEQ